MGEAGNVLHLKATGGRQAGLFGVRSPEQRELRTVQVLAKSILAREPLPEILGFAHEAILDLLGPERAEFTLDPTVVRVEHPASELVVPLTADDEILATCRITGQDGRESSHHDAQTARRICAMAALPIRSAHPHVTPPAPRDRPDAVVGVVALGSLGTRELDRHDLSFLVAVSRPIAVAVGNARLFAGLQRSNAERRELVAALVDAQEAERQRVAEDIHDDTIQVMA